MTFFSEDIKLFPIAFLEGVLCKIFALLNKLFCLAVIPVTSVFLSHIYKWIPIVLQSWPGSFELTLCVKYWFRSSCIFCSFYTTHVTNRQGFLLLLLLLLHPVEWWGDIYIYLCHMKKKLVTDLRLFKWRFRSTVSRLSDIIWSFNP